jgi:hypothetical protein
MLDDSPFVSISPLLLEQETQGRIHSISHWHLPKGELCHGGSALLKMAVPKWVYSYGVVMELLLEERSAVCRTMCDITKCCYGCESRRWTVRVARAVVNTIMIITTKSLQNIVTRCDRHIRKEDTAPYRHQLYGETGKLIGCWRIDGCLWIGWQTVRLINVLTVSSG